MFKKKKRVRFVSKNLGLSKADINKLEKLNKEITFIYTDGSPIGEVLEF